MSSSGSAFGSDLSFDDSRPRATASVPASTPPASVPASAAARISGAKTSPESSRTTDSSGFGLHGQPTFEDRVYGRQDIMKEMHHETMMSIFKKHQHEYEILLRTNNIYMLKMFIQQNFGKIVWLDFLQEKLKEVLEAFATEDQKRLILENDYNPDSMIKMLRYILEDFQRKFALVDMSFEFPGTAEGLSTVVEKTRRKMGDVINELQTTIRDQQEEIAVMKDNLLQITELESQLAALRKYIKHLVERDKYAVEDPSTRDVFMEELRYQLNMQEHLSSSFREQLEQERASKEEILQRFLQVEAQRVEDHQTKMREIAEATKNLEMEELLRKGIVEKMRGLSPNPDDVNRAVDEWIKTTQEVIEQKKQEVQSTAKAMKELTERLVQMHVNTEERERALQIEKIKFERKEPELNDLAEKYKNDIKAKEVEVANLKEEYEQLDDESDELLNAVSFLRSENQRLNESAAYYKGNISKVTGDLRRGAIRGEGALQTVPEDEEMPPPHFRDLQQRMRRRLRPKRRERWRYSRTPELPGEELRYSEHAADSSFVPPLPDSPLLYPSSQRRIPEVTITPPPPPAMQSSPAFSEVTSPIVTTPSPESDIYRNGESPFRQTYLNGTAKSTLPSSSSFEATPIRQSIVLTSPRTSQNFLVNIGVDPKPITSAADGECFTCDISLDIQPGGKSLLPQLPQQIEGQSPYQLHMPSYMSPSRSRDGTIEMNESPVIKGRRVGRYNVPPPVTPTTDRRYGLFTPRGIFKKRHFNIRRIPGKDPISELPWSPTYLPEEGTTPLSQLLPAPSSYLSDRSMSWEKSPDSYYQPFASKIAKIGYKGPFPAYSAPDFSESPSPVIKGPTRMYLSPESASPSPVIKGPTRRYLSPEYSSPFGKTPIDTYYESEYERSPSPVIKGPTYRYRSPGSDHSSPSPVIKGPNYRYSGSDHSSPSPVIKGPTYWGYKPQDSDHSSPSLALGRGFHRDQSPVIQSPLFDSSQSGYQSDFDTSRSSEANRMYDSSSPQYPRYQEDSFNRRLRFDDELKVDDLNRRWMPEEMLPSGNMFDSSSLSPTNQRSTSRSPHEISYQENLLNRRLRFDDEPKVDDLNRRWIPEEMFPSGNISDSSSSPANQRSISRSPHERSYQEDPLNRRIQLDEMFESSRTPDHSVSPQMIRTPTYISPEGASGTDSTESERGYLEGSPYGSSLLNEAQYFK